MKSQLIQIYEQIIATNRPPVYKILENLYLWAQTFEVKIPEKLQLEYTGYYDKKMIDLPEIK